MKVGEVREKLKTYDQATLMELFVEAYKMLPKNRKEELDPLLENYAQIVADKKAGKKPNQAPPIDFNNLAMDIEEFIADAYAQNYFIPNRKIPKAKRPKWRFIVKDYIKQLMLIPSDDGDYPAAAGLLKKLYQMLCYGCGHYIFSTEDPFRSD